VARGDGAEGGDQVVVSLAVDHPGDGHEHGCTGRDAELGTDLVARTTGTGVVDLVHGHRLVQHRHRLVDDRSEQPGHGLGLGDVVLHRTTLDPVPRRRRHHTAHPTQRAGVVGQVRPEVDPLAVEVSDDRYPGEQTGEVPERPVDVGVHVDQVDPALADEADELADDGGAAGAPGVETDGRRPGPLEGGPHRLISSDRGDGELEPPGGVARHVLEHDGLPAADAEVGEDVEHLDRRRACTGRMARLGRRGGGGHGSTFTCSSTQGMRGAHERPYRICCSCRCRSTRLLQSTYRLRPLSLDSTGCRGLHDCWR
jgi:hypothetical protein